MYVYMYMYTNNEKPQRRRRYNGDQIVSVNVTTLYQRKVDILNPDVKEVRAYATSCLFNNPPHPTPTVSSHPSPSLPAASMAMAMLLMQVEFSYSVDWVEEPALAWPDRMLRYVDSRFIPSTFEVRPPARPYVALLIHSFVPTSLNT